MATYSEGIMNDGAAILKDGIPMRVEEIVEALNARKPTEVIGHLNIGKAGMSFGFGRDVFSLPHGNYTLLREGRP